jgi:hypothetical protein
MYPHCATRKVAEVLGRPVYSVYNAAAVHGLRKTAAFYQSDDVAAAMMAVFPPEVAASGSEESTRVQSLSVLRAKKAQI